MRTNIFTVQEIFYCYILVRNTCISGEVIIKYFNLIRITNAHNFLPFLLIPTHPTSGVSHCCKRALQHPGSPPAPGYNSLRLLDWINKRYSSFKCATINTPEWHPARRSCKHPLVLNATPPDPRIKGLLGQELPQESPPLLSFFRSNIHRRGMRAGQPRRPLMTTPFSANENAREGRSRGAEPPRAQCVIPCLGGKASRRVPHGRTSKEVSDGAQKIVAGKGVGRRAGRL